MGRHRAEGRDDPRGVHAIIAAIEEEDYVAPEPSTTPILMDETGRFHPPPTHVRWVSAAAGLGVLATGGLLAADGPATNEIAAVAPASQATILAAEPVTGEQIRADLSALQASRAEREAAEEQAQAAQAEADRVETERRAEEARQKAAEEAELARQQAAQEEATRESQRAAQEAAERAAEATTGRHRAEAAQEAQQTVEEVVPEEEPETVAVSADGPGAIVPGGRVTSGFGARWGTTHYGVDVAGPLGSPIYSPVAGTVLRAGPASGFGNAIYIEDSDGTVWLFGHMRVMNVSAGEHVNIGDKIALVGNEGQSTGPHVHIERHVGGMNGTKVDPAPRLGL